MLLLNAYFYPASNWIPSSKNWINTFIWTLSVPFQTLFAWETQVPVMLRIITTYVASINIGRTINMMYLMMHLNIYFNLIYLLSKYNNGNFVMGYLYINSLTTDTAQRITPPQFYLRALARHKSQWKMKILLFYQRSDQK